MIRSDRRSGFTMIEVLITLVIVGLLLSLLYGVLVTTLQSKKKVEKISTRERVRAGIIRLIAQDLRGVYTYSITATSGDGPPEPILPGGDSGKKPSAQSKIPRIEGAFLGKDQGDADSISFVTTRDHEGSGEELGTSFSRIHYTLQAGSEPGLQTLFRGVEPFIEGQESGSDVRYEEVYNRITIFDLSYLEAVGDTDWKTSWSAARPPLAIRLNVDFRLHDDPEDAEPEPFEVIISIPTS
ncbi:MAG: prepilin-type N-terminal cleavage/methylation domain-containing protein [Planctomycetota bacterium]|nr:prepilin-type N-terminal cleavage/methylation domain-containing protein [Planctomycetota bacterium]